MQPKHSLSPLLVVELCFNLVFPSATNNLVLGSTILMRIVEEN